MNNLNETFGGSGVFHVKATYLVLQRLGGQDNIA